VVWIVYVIIVIVMIKLPTSSLTIIAGGLSAGIGIAMKDIINNFVYGIQLMSGRVRVGDWIECDGIRGRVTNISYQSTQIETIEGAVMSFLNEALFNKNFSNLTHNNSYEFVKIIVGVSYGTDIAKVREVLVEAMQQMRTKDSYGREVVDPKKGIYVAFDSFDESAVNIAVKQYILVAEHIAYVDKAKEVIYDALNSAGISIPFPQRDIHIVTGE
jgi:small-conductance mechanosensitive channel